jgi:hypothetical protein
MLFLTGWHPAWDAGGAAGKRAVALTPAPVLKTYWVPSARSTLLYSTLHYSTLRGTPPRQQNTTAKRSCSAACTVIVRGYFRHTCLSLEICQTGGVPGIHPPGE